jgi:hypothetical protein
MFVDWQVQTRGVEEGTDLLLLPHSYLSTRCKHTPKGEFLNKCGFAACYVFLGELVWKLTVFTHKPNTLTRKHEMGRPAILVAAVLLLLCGLTDVLPAQITFSTGVGPGGGFGRGRARTANVFGGFGNYGYTTLFDLYKNGQIPVPPYFSLHPPVYYGNVARQDYGRTPFAFPYTWWQQYGLPNASSPYAVPDAGRSGPFRTAPTVIVNPHVQEETTLTLAEPKVIHNPYVQPLESSLAATIEMRSD